MSGYISAGSAARATAAGLTAVGASVEAIGTILLLGKAVVEYFSAQAGQPLALTRQGFNLWVPA